jgi:HEAT repeat protein
MRYLWFLGILLLIWLASRAPAKEPSLAESFAEQIRHLEPTRPKAERLAALKWIHSQCARKEAAAVMPALERSIKKDPDPEVRTKAVETLGMVAYQIRPRTCPLAVLEAMTDPHDDVRSIAMGVSGMFDRVASGSVPVLLKLARAENAAVRGHAVLMLAFAEAKNPKSLEVARRAIQDKDENVRHDGFSALFRITGKLDEAVPYWLRAQETMWSGLRPEPASASKDEQIRRNLRRLGAFGKLYELGEERTEEFAKLLMSFLDGKSAEMRRAAAAYIGNIAYYQVTFSKVGFLVPRHPQETRGPTYVPYKSGASNQKPQESNTLFQFKIEAALNKLKVEDRLHKVAARDPDATVQAAARYALKQRRATEAAGNNHKKIER